MLQYDKYEWRVCPPRKLGAGAVGRRTFTQGRDWELTDILSRVRHVYRPYVGDHLLFSTANSPIRAEFLVSSSRWITVPRPGLTFAVGFRYPAGGQ